MSPVTNISLTFGHSVRENTTASRISLPANSSKVTTPTALMQLPVDFHGEPAKTLQKRLPAVNVAAAPFNMLAPFWDWEAGVYSSTEEPGTLADWFHQRAARPPNRTVSSVPNSRIDPSTAPGVGAVTMSSQPNAMTARAAAPPMTRSQIGRELADIYYPDLSL